MANSYFLGFPLKLSPPIHRNTSISFLFSLSDYNNVKFCMEKPPHRIVLHYSGDKRRWRGGDGHSRNHKSALAFPKSQALQLFKGEFGKK